MPGSAIFDSSLVDELYPTIDELKSDLLPEMGIRQYRVFAVTRTWSGEQVGEGTFADVASEFDPIPKVLDWNNSLAIKQHACGELVEGDVLLVKLSRSYTYDEIMAGEAVMNEQHLIRIDEGHGQLTPSRFFRHVHEPYKNAMGWICHLRKVQA